MLVFSGWQSQHAMSIKSLAPAHSKPAGAFSFDVGFGRRSFLCDVARKLQRGQSGCASPISTDGRWSAVKSHLSVMTEAPVQPRAGASSWFLRLATITPHPQF